MSHENAKNYHNPTMRIREIVRSSRGHRLPEDRQTSEQPPEALGHWTNSARLARHVYFRSCSFSAAATST